MSQPGAHRGSIPSYDATAPLVSQRTALAQQDTDLGSLEAGVATVKRVATLINDEVDGQNALLDEVDGEESRMQGAVRRTAGRTAAAVAEGDAYNFRTFCMLLWPLVLLIVLFVEAILHFLF